MIRTDTEIIDAGVNGLYVKLKTFHDQADGNWDVWNCIDYWDNRPYKYVLIEERFPG